MTLANDEEDATESSATTLRGTARALQTTGLGYKHKLIWTVCPKFEGQGVAHLFQGYVDAHTQEVMELTNTVDLFVEGGVYPISNDGKLSRADCSENDTALCNLSSLTLQNIANIHFRNVA